MDLAVDYALRYGYRLFDSALLYGNGAELGAALERHLPRHGLRRQDVFLTSKILPQLGNNTELTPQLFDQVLKDLRTDYLDLLLVHAPRPLHAKSRGVSGYRRDTWLAMERLWREGRVRSIGVSNYGVKHLEEMMDYAAVRPSINQVWENICSVESREGKKCRVPPRQPLLGARY